MEKKYRGQRRMAEQVRMIQERCMYVPSFDTCPAPNAWPQSVSRALPMPNCQCRGQIKKNLNKNNRLTLTLTQKRDEEYLLRKLLNFLLSA